MNIPSYFTRPAADPSPAFWKPFPDPEAVLGTTVVLDRSESPDNARRVEDILHVDVWILILDLIVKECAGCFETCSSSYFPQFLREWGDLRVPPSHANQWKRLRRVCRLWAQILDPDWTPYREASDRALIAKGKRIRTLHIDDSGSWAGKNKFKHDRQFVQAIMHVHTIVITEDRKDDEKLFIDSLFRRSDIFTRLRSLRLSTLRDEKLDETFWSDLERCLPQLVALSIASSALPSEPHISSTLGELSCTGSITLPKLEILQLAIDRIPQCTFESLRHCSLGLSKSREMSPHSNAPPLPRFSLPLYVLDVFHELLYSHRQKLESIILFDFPDAFVLDRLKGSAIIDAYGETIWSTFPNLRLLGTSSAVTSKLCTPAPELNHPFHHIFINQSPASFSSASPYPPSGIPGLFPFTSDPVAEISQVILNIPAINSLTLDSRIGPDIPYGYNMANRLQFLCQFRGIRYQILPPAKKTRFEWAQELRYLERLAGVATKPTGFTGF